MTMETEGTPPGNKMAGMFQAVRNLLGTQHYCSDFTEHLPVKTLSYLSGTSLTLRNKPAPHKCTNAATLIAFLFSLFPRHIQMKFSTIGKRGTVKNRTLFLK
jgi:hypothetical protein